MNSLTVISPVYNEAEVIEDFYKELKAVLSTLNYESKILFVVDRCTDQTLDILRKIAEKDPIVQVLALSSRFGHQMSLVAGIDHANSDIAIMMDSDLQHPPEIIPKMIQEYEKGNDVVYTTRLETEKIRFTTKLLSKCYYRFMKLISDTDINENTADFRLITKRVIKVLQEHIRERNLFLRGIISWIGFQQSSISYTAKQRKAGASKYSLGRRVRLGAQGIFSFSKKPLQAAIFTGVFLALAGFLFGIFTCFQYIFYQTLPMGWATLVSLLTGFSGIQLIFLGVVGLYIGGIFDEVKQRPHYLVAEKLNI